MAEDALAVTPPPSAVSEEEQARAGVYALLGSVLAKPCSSEVRDFLDSIPLDGAGADVQLPWQKLQSEIASADLEELAHEYHALFVGLGRGELLPYGSVYLTGFCRRSPWQIFAQTFKGSALRSPTAHTNPRTMPERSVK